MEIGKENVEFLNDKILSYQEVLEEFYKKGKSMLSENGYRFVTCVIAGNNVYVKFVNSKIEIIGKAKCHPNDEFNKVVGKAKAMKRILVQIFGDEFYIDV